MFHKYKGYSMNNDLMRCAVIATLFTMPFTMQSMFLTLAKNAKRTSLPLSMSRRTFFNSACELRNKIGTPHFKLRETKKIISNLSSENINGCDANGLIEYVVFKATEHKESEKKYAAVLGQLRGRGWRKSTCCIDVMLHSAVISNLPSVTKELLQHDSDWVNTQDLHECVPMDYAQSPRIIKMLKAAGSRDAQPYTGKDKWYRVPGYGWREATPLRKAVYDGDITKVSEIKSLTNGDLEILQAIADLRFWRTRDEKYLRIKESISMFRSQAGESAFFPTGYWFDLGPTPKLEKIK